MPRSCHDAILGWLLALISAPQSNVKGATPGVEIFADQVDTTSGPASSAMGPFYFPGDQVAYFDSCFFSDLRTEFGADGGDLAEEYVVANEYGHHIQHTIGTLAASRQGGRGANSGSVRVEWQAHCFAGMWVAYASQATGANGNTFMKPLTGKDLRSALSAAAGLGDDRIQQAATGRVSPRRPDPWFLGAT